MFLNCLSVSLVTLLAFDQIGGVLELQSRVVDSPLTGKLFGAACEFLVLHLLYGRNNFV